MAKEGTVVGSARVAVDGATDLEELRSMFLAVLGQSGRVTVTNDGYAYYPAFSIMVAQVRFVTSRASGIAAGPCVVTVDSLTSARGWVTWGVLVWSGALSGWYSATQPRSLVPVALLFATSVAGVIMALLQRQRPREQISEALGIAATDHAISLSSLGMDKLLGAASGAPAGTSS